LKEQELGKLALTALQFAAVFFVLSGW
jgi:hypothetical protein